MNYIQVKTPNLTISEKAGLCLQFAENSFNVPNLYDNAWEAWLATQYKHLDRNFPVGVAVPVWFDWSGNVMWSDKIVRFGQYGHAAVRAADGKIHSAPGEGVGSQTFNSIDELTSYFGGGMTYVGWSEDIAGVRVIKEKEIPPAIWTPMSKVRVMVAKQDARKYDTDKHTFETEASLSKGDGRLFLTKTVVNGRTFIRTDTDTDKGSHTAYLIDDFENGTSLQTKQELRLRALEGK